MSEDPKRTLTDGSPVPSDGSHRALKPNGQQRGYVVLSAEERAKGFVRPLRFAYVHVGRPLPPNLRDLTEAEAKQYAAYGYVKYEAYGPDRSPTVGRFWTQPELDRSTGGCLATTTMSLPLAETYARDPKFYGGTFCCACREHLPLEEFVWEGTQQRLGN